MARIGPVKPVRKPMPFKAGKPVAAKPVRKGEVLKAKPVRKVTPVARTKSAPAKPLTAEGKKKAMYQMDSFAKNSKTVNNLKKQAGGLKKQVANKQLIDMKKTIDKKTASTQMKKTQLAQMKKSVAKKPARKSLGGGTSRRASY